MKKQKLLALLLAAAMFLSVIAYSPMAVYADEGGDSGSTGGSDSGSTGGSDSGSSGGSDSGSTGGGDSGSSGGDSGSTGGGDSGSSGGDSGSTGGDSGSSGGSDSGSTGGDDSGSSGWDDPGSSGGDDSGSTGGNVNDTPSDIDLSDIQWFPLFSYDNYIKDPKAPKGNDRITYVPAEQVPMREAIEGAEVSFTEERISIPNGMQIDLNYYVSATPAADLIDWECSDTTVATVDEYGFLTGISMGSCWVYAYLGTEQASIFVEVDPNEAAPLPYEHTYALRMNRSYNNITVYTLDENGEYTVPVRTFRCAGGYRSPYGVQHILYQMEWNPMNGNHWAHWCAQIFNSFMMHSTPYYYRNQHSLIYHNYQEFGTTASAGCVRLLVRDAKWVYDNCNVGTIIDYYFDLENPGPLGKNEVIYLPNGNCSWEPTDPDTANPWFGGKPSITGVCDLTVEAGKELDYFSHVTCKDSLGNSISSNLRITSGVDIHTPGTYPVVYKLTDAAYKTVYAYCYVTVTEATAGEATA